MKVRDLINAMHPTEVVTVDIHTRDIPTTTIFKGKSLGKVKNLKIPEAVLDKEVDYYTMYYHIVTHKGKEENYEALPYIELEIVFAISVY